MRFANILFVLIVALMGYLLPHSSHASILKVKFEGPGSGLVEVQPGQENVYFGTLTLRQVEERGAEVGSGDPRPIHVFSVSPTALIDYGMDGVDRGFTDLSQYVQRCRLSNAMTGSTVEPPTEIILDEHLLLDSGFNVGRRATALNLVCDISEDVTEFIRVEVGFAFDILDPSDIVSTADRVVILANNGGESPDFMNYVDNTCRWDVELADGTEVEMSNELVVDDVYTIDTSTTPGIVDALNTNFSTLHECSDLQISPTSVFVDCWSYDDTGWCAGLSSVYMYDTDSGALLGEAAVESGACMEDGYGPCYPGDTCILTICTHTASFDGVSYAPINVDAEDILGVTFSVDGTGATAASGDDRVTVTVPEDSIMVSDDGVDYHMIAHDEMVGPTVFF